MAKSKRVTFFKANLEDKPGALLAVAKDLKAKKLGLVALTGFGTQPGQGELLVIPKSPDKLRAAWKASGMLVEEGTAFLITGTDTTGALVKSLEAMIKAGINIVGLDAIAVGGKYGSLMWVPREDVEKTAKALGAK